MDIIGYKIVLHLVIYPCYIKYPPQELEEIKKDG